MVRSSSGTEHMTAYDGSLPPSMFDYGSSIDVVTSLDTATFISHYDAKSVPVIMKSTFDLSEATKVHLHCCQMVE